MNSTRVVVLVIFAVVGLTVAPVSGGAVAISSGDDSSVQSDQPTAAAHSPATDTSGTPSETATANVSTFVQATTADAETTVDTGLFEAQYDRADNESKADVVADRADEFDERLAQLEAERDELREQEANLSDTAYEARMTRLTVDIATLNRSIERVKPQGVAVGHDEDRFATLQQNAAELAGPEVAATAQGLAGVDDPGAGAGSDAGAGPPDETPANQSSGHGVVSESGTENENGNEAAETPADEPTDRATQGKSANGTGNDESNGQSNSPEDVMERPGSESESASTGTDAAEPNPESERDTPPPADDVESTDGDSAN